MLLKQQILRLILFSILVIILISLGLIYYRVLPAEDKKPKQCDNINRNLSGLTFEQSYCQGDMCVRICDENGRNCHDVTTIEECEVIDVVLENDISKSEKDGISDCKWVNNNCLPNK